MVEVSASADLSPMMWGKSAYPHPGKFLGSGNRCGHDPARLAAERLALPETKGGHWPQVITRLMKKVQAYFLDPQSQPLLTYAKKKQKKDGSFRQNRSEAREAQALVATAIFSRLDLKSLRVGTYAPNGEFRPTSFDELARLCNITKEHPEPGHEDIANSRFWRAVSDLKQAGVMEVFEQYEETPDGARGRSAIKTVSEKFLRVLGGLTKTAMAEARKKSSKKIAKYLGTAVEAGVLSTEEREQLSDNIRSTQTRKELFPKPAIKNTQPVDFEHPLVTDVEAYKAFSDSIHSKIVEALGRQPTLAENSRMFRQFGGLSLDEWTSRRRQL